MKAGLKLILLLVLVMGLVSCATTGPKFAEMNVERVAKDPGQGRIFIYRPSALGAAVQPDVLLNTERIGEAKSWGFFYVDRPPGDYVVVTSTEVTRKCSFTLEKGQTRYIRLSISFGFFVGHIYGELVDESVGQEEIATCRYIGN